MEYINLGKTGLKVLRILLACVPELFLHRRVANPLQLVAKHHDHYETAKTWERVLLTPRVSDDLLLCPIVAEAAA